MAEQQQGERIYLFDTTLRDGQQAAGVDFSIEDKILISQILDELGLDYIEGGYPGANPTDTQFFSESYGLKNARMTAFGMTKKSGRSADNDPGLAMVLDAEAEAVCLVAKSWDYHVDVALGISNEENLKSITESVQAVVAHDKEAMIDCEHFFDGYKHNPDYALQCAHAAMEAGARWVVLCDTNGGTMPSEVYDIVTMVTKHIAGENLGIHAHNDTENAVANSLAAVQAGVRQVQGTLNGLGERCGNANMVSLIPTFLLKKTFADAFDIGVPLENLQQLTIASRQLDDVLNYTPNRRQPYVGDSAFAHKGGIHVSAVMKDPATYEHIKPELVGNRRKILVSNQAGRSNILARLKHAGIDVKGIGAKGNDAKGNDAKDNDEAVQQILTAVKEKEQAGYSFDNAGASFELLAREILGDLPIFFEVETYQVKVSHQGGALEDSVATAQVSLKIDGESLTTKGTGNGPVNALDMALRADLRRYAPYLADLRLVDYKVRILNTGTAAVTRVEIESADSEGRSWRTIGVSENVVAASFRALHDAIIFKLLRSGVSATPEG